MTRLGAAALLLLAVVGPGCGKYGPPVRRVPEARDAREAEASSPSAEEDEAANGGEASEPRESDS
jgi:hypothetical protein